MYEDVSFEHSFYGFCNCFLRNKSLLGLFLLILCQVTVLKIYSFNGKSSALKETLNYTCKGLSPFSFQTLRLKKRNSRIKILKTGILRNQMYKGSRNMTTNSVSNTSSIGITLKK